MMASWEESKNSLVGSNIEFVSIPDGLGPEEDRSDLKKLIVAISSSMPAMLERLIEDFVRVNGNYSRISCIVVDVSMGWALEIASELGIRRAALSTFSATMFALQYSLRKMVDDGIIDCNGMPIQKRPFRLSPSMSIMHTDQIFWSKVGDFDCNKVSFDYMKRFTQAFDLAEWWLCNTTYELEPKSLSFLPKLLPIGPYMGSSHSTRSLGQFWEEDLSCLN
ncbi:hypothetical protein L6164_006726 [Bauhinia variegata]|uniref:Uncharacterized protein n=1 Tax=Bauhinia variegata TaxID=167791 RepID=A0ACB9PVC9_BAUVA|nr:hypothetical protein L6164_006726 [Bauhinia variegata]